MSGEALKSIAVLNPLVSEINEFVAGKIPKHPFFPFVSSKVIN